MNVLNYSNHIRLYNPNKQTNKNTRYNQMKYEKNKKYILSTYNRSKKELRVFKEME